MQELYEHYKEQDPEGSGVSISYFNKVWRNKRPHLKPKSGSTFMKCEECTLLKDTLYGAPGVRATLDPKTVEGARARHQVHLEVRGCCGLSVGSSPRLHSL